MLSSSLDGAPAVAKILQLSAYSSVPFFFLLPSSHLPFRCPVDCGFCDGVVFLLDHRADPYSVVFS